jgi:hypothetical protein
MPKMGPIVFNMLVVISGICIHALSELDQTKLQNNIDSMQGFIFYSKLQR